MSMTVHIVFGFRDGDIVYWRSALPKNCFTYYVREIVNSERNKEIAVLPMPEERGILMRKEEVQLIFRTNVEIRFIRSLPKGKRASMLKSIIRKHLLANYRRVGLELSDIPVQQETVPATEESKQEEIAENISEQEVNNSKEEKESDKVELVEDEDEMSEEYKKILREMAGY